MASKLIVYLVAKNLRIGCLFGRFQTKVRAMVSVYLLLVMVIAPINILIMVPISVSPVIHEDIRSPDIRGRDPQIFNISIFRLIPPQVVIRPLLEKQLSAGTGFG